MTKHSESKPASKPAAEKKPSAEAVRKAENAVPAKDTLTPPHKAGEKFDGEHITQNKMNIGEAMAHSGVGNATLEDVGTGSVTEEAPAVRSTISHFDRIVQQGDEVIVHGRAIIDGQTQMPGLVLKVNQSGSIAVRVQRSTGQTFDVPGEVHNADLGDGSFYWTWPEVETLTPTLDKSAAKE